MNSLRRSFATDLIERGATILDVKELMGRSNIRSTRNMYTGKKYESDLINSYAGDTTIVFIQKCGTKTNSDTYSMQGSLQREIAKTGEATDFILVGDKGDRAKMSHKKCRKMLVD